MVFYTLGRFFNTIKNKMNKLIKFEIINITTKIKNLYSYVGGSPRTSEYKNISSSSFSSTIDDVKQLIMSL